MEALDEYIGTRFGSFRARDNQSPLQALRRHLDEVVEESIGDQRWRPAVSSSASESRSRPIDENRPA
jgi:hypothetical protein